MQIDQALVEQAAAALMCAGHGKKTELAERFAQQWQCSVQTVYRRVGKIKRHVNKRKRRADRGDSQWRHDELLAVAAYLMESHRNTGKRLASVDDALDTLRANGVIRGAVVDDSTGELVRYLSADSCLRALKVNHLHPDDLRAPAPKVTLGTEHPNQLWQCDPSLCVLYYLQDEEGLRVMPEDEFYKNKPKNLHKVMNKRVWRYVFTDHASGAFYVEYVLGAESGENLCRTFIHAMQPRGLGDPFHGAPMIIMLDPGSANTGAMFTNLCAGLGVSVMINKPKQPWAKGQVEQANNLIECRFEHRLAFHKVASLAALNDAVWAWMRRYNHTAKHSRHGSSRYQAWMTIAADKLRVPPDVETCLRLATHVPVTRKVNTLLRISFKKQHFDVSAVPGVYVGQVLTVTRHPFGDKHDVQVKYTNDDGFDVWYALQPLETTKYGFVDPVMVGSYRPHAETVMDSNRRAVERAAMLAASDAEAEDKRKAGALPFDGSINPHKDIEDAKEVAHLPRRGTKVTVDAPVVMKTPEKVERIEPRREFPPVSHVEAARRIKPLVERAGKEWTGTFYQQLVERFPEGVPIDQIEDLAREFSTPPRGGLQIIDGGVK